MLSSKWSHNRFASGGHPRLDRLFYATKSQKDRGFWTFAMALRAGRIGQMERCLIVNFCAVDAYGL